MCRVHRFGGDHRQRGFTLVEAMLATALLALVVIAVTAPFTASVWNVQADGRRVLAANLAHELMEEILSKPFRDPQGASVSGPEANESGRRGDFDNIDDYDGYAEEAGAIVTGDGTPVITPESVGLSRRVEATYVTVPGQLTPSEPAFIRIKVTVKYYSQPLVCLARLAGGPPE